jgi:methylated-DNA-protein-cysteine methyltransferase-like protein
MAARPKKYPRRASKARPEVRPFERVWAIVKRIPRGRVATYGLVSELIDRRLTPVGVGWAIRAAAEGSIPWHRVINTRGGISTDGEHPGLQRAMLESEGVSFDESGCADLERVMWRPRRSAKER